MEKVTKKELWQKINILQSKNITNRNLIFRIKRALASIDIDIMSDDFDTTDEPKLKQLDQSVFDDLDEKWRFAARCLSGKAIATESKPRIILNGYYCEEGYLLIGEGYDTTNWQNSLIERDKVELTGSDLCRAMLERGDKAVLCLVIENKETGVKRYDAITKTSGRRAFLSHYAYHHNAVPVNNQGEPLTASEVGL